MMKKFFAFLAASFCTASVAATTWNPAAIGTGITLTNGNLTANPTSVSGWTSGRATTSKASGKWYFEVTIGASGTNTNVEIGVMNSGATLSSYIGSDTNGFGIGGSPTSYQICGSSGGVTSFNYSNGAVIGIALDVTNRLIYYSINGTWAPSQNPSGGTGGQSLSACSLSSGFFPGVAFFATTANTLTGNFGPSFSETVPTGFSGWDTTVATPFLFNPAVIP